MHTPTPFGATSLLRLQGEKATAPLTPGEIRYSVPFDAWPYEVPEDVRATSKRFVVKDTHTGKKRWEVPEFANGRRPLLTVCGDQGGSGLPSWMFLCGGLKLRCLQTYYRYHRVNRDRRLALKENNLWCIVLEMQVVLNFVFGPWKSESWWVQLVEGAEDYARTCGPEDRRSKRCVERARPPASLVPLFGLSDDALPSPTRGSLMFGSHRRLSRRPTLDLG